MSKPNIIGYLYDECDPKCLDCATPNHEPLTDHGLPNGFECVECLGRVDSEGTVHHTVSVHTPSPAVRDFARAICEAYALDRNDHWEDDEESSSTFSINNWLLILTRRGNTVKVHGYFDEVETDWSDEHLLDTATINNQTNERNHHA